MNRRDLLKYLLASPLAATFDYEQLLWVPKPIVSVPALSWQRLVLAQVIGPAGEVLTSWHIRARIERRPTGNVHYVAPAAFTDVPPVPIGSTFSEIRFEDIDMPKDSLLRGWRPAIHFQAPVVANGSDVTLEWSPAGMFYLTDT